MSKRLSYLLWIPAILLIVLVLSKKGIGTRTPLIPKADLLRTEAVWKQHEFVKIQDETVLRESISQLVGSQPISDASKRQAEEVCVGILKAYATRDWNLFKAFRIPIQGYNVDPEVLKALKNFSPKISDSPVEMYEALWKQTFASNCLFSSISLISNSISSLKVSAEKSSTISFPEFTAKTNENWLEDTVTTAFDYTKLSTLNTEKDSATVLRFFFFGTREDNEGARPFMITFLWDNQSGKWLPWRLTHASTKPTVHRIRFF